LRGREPVRILYLQHGKANARRVEPPEGVPGRATSQCPVCGWEYKRPFPEFKTLIDPYRMIYQPAFVPGCPHFVTAINERSPTYGGTESGAFGEIADDVLGPLAEAAQAVRQADAGGREWPRHLQRVIEALAGENQAYRPDRNINSNMESVDPDGRQVDFVQWELRSYVEETFEEADPSGLRTYPFWDDWALSYPRLLWSPDAAKTAQDMARLIAEDVARLQEAVRNRPGRDKGRRNNGRPEFLGLTVEGTTMPRKRQAQTPEFDVLTTGRLTFRDLNRMAKQLEREGNPFTPEQLDFSYRQLWSEFLNEWGLPPDTPFPEKPPPIPKGSTMTTGAESAGSFEEADHPEYREEDCGESDQCPFCGWSLRTEYTGDCRHCLMNTDSPDTDYMRTYPGDTAGEFAAVSQEYLPRLIEAVSRFLAGPGRDRQRTAGLMPPRLRRLVETVASWPYLGDDDDADHEWRLFANYVEELCRDVGGEYRRTTFGTHGCGTSGTYHVLWNADASRTAQDMAQLIAADVARLKKAVPSRPSRGKGRRPPTR
jgi:hypothetical protein